MYLGIDLGGTKIAAGIGDEKLNLDKTIQKPTPQKREEILEEIRKIAEDFCSQFEIKSIGVGVPGAVNNDGAVVKIPNLEGWDNFPLEEKLNSMLPKKTYIENDANCAALAELVAGAGKKYDNFIYITLSTGIGGGIVIGGEIYRGAEGTAGEIGHMIIDVNGPQCGCGRTGCWEALASGTAISKLAKETPEITEEGKEVNAILAADLAEKGNESALKIFQKVVEYNAIGISNLANILNPQAVILGGGLTKRTKLVFDPLVEELKKRNVNTIIEKAVHETGVMGTIALAVKNTT